MPEEEVISPTPPADPPKDPPADPPGDGTPPSDPPKDEDDGADPDKFDSPAAAPKKEEKPKVGEDDEDDLDDADEKRIEKAVEKKYGSAFKELETIRENQHKDKVEADLAKILNANPEYKQYEARIRRFVNHDNRSGLIKQGLPVRTVVIEAIEPYLQKIGAEKAKAADEKANKERGGGDQKEAAPTGKVDYTTMSAKEIEEMGEQVKSGRYKPQK